MKRKVYQYPSRHGTTLIYASIVAIVIFGIASLAVDWGRAQLAKTELQRALVAAARYATSGLSDGTASTKAITAAAENMVDGSALVLQSSDIQTGIWSNNTFTATTINPNAVQITGYRTAARGTAIPLYFGRAIGRSTCDVTCTVVAALGATTGSTSTSTTSSVAGTNSIWYAGLPNGTRITDPYGYDEVGNGTSASAISGITLQSNAILTFTATGLIDNSIWDSYAGTAPGGEYYMSSYNQQSQTPWMASITAPSMGLVGVFLDNTTPSSSQTAPADLDYSVTSDYTSQTPKLRQPFFIGTGKNADGSSKKIVVPAGATRLYLGANDSWIWRDNAGAFSVTTTQTSVNVITVK